MVASSSRGRSPSSSRDSSPTASGEPARKQQRKERKKYSCEECRRLKLKCNREFPCDNCVKRGCKDICPSGVRHNVRAGGRKSTNGPTREEQLERLLLENGIALPGHLLLSGDNIATKPVVEQLPPAGVEAAAEAAAPVGAPAREAGAEPSTSSRQMMPPQTDMVHNLPPLAPELDPNVGLTGSSIDSAALGFNVEDTHSSGTLVITSAGRSKYLGPRAANEWLKDQEVDEPEDSPPVTRAPSPTLGTLMTGKAESSGRSFPFASPKADSISSLLSRLPPESQARALLGSYYRYFTWSYDIVPHDKLQTSLDLVYAKAQLGTSVSVDSPVLFVHQLALVFVVLAMGALHHLELLPDDSLAEECLANARACLTKGNFLVYNTVPGVQTLHLMAHVHLETEKGRNGDTAWPLWGLAMRMIQAMGVHRDGLRWNLPPEDVEERRLVFWNTYTADVLQANCFSRPNSIQARYFDVSFPYDETFVHSHCEERGFHTIKYEICQISADILDQTLDLQTPTMDAVMALHHRLSEFERHIPYRLRCRTALISLPSLYSESEAAKRDSPEVDRWDLQLTFQQHFLSLLISEALINLHRPYFVRALQGRPEDPVRSAFGASFLAVIERSNVLIQIACSLHSLHPSVAARHWFLWYHAFNSAVTLGTVILADPQGELASFSLAQMDVVINVYTTLALSRTSPRLSQNLRWLMRLRQRAVDHLGRSRSQTGNVSGRRGGDGSSGSGSELPLMQPSDANEDQELLGWRTRLIERTSKGVRKATTIVSTLSPSTMTTTPSPNTRLEQSMTDAIQQYISGPQPDSSLHLQPTLTESGSTELYTSTDYLLHNFWDPTTVLGVTADSEPLSSVGWWDVDFALNAGSSAVPNDSL